MKVSTKSIREQLSAAIVALKKCEQTEYTGEINEMLEDAESLMLGATTERDKLHESIYTEDGDLKP